MKKQEIKLNGDILEIRDGDGVEMILHVTAGTIKISTPPTIPKGDTERIEGTRNALKVKPLVPIEQELNRIEEEEALKIRMKNRTANDEDYLKVIEEIAKGPVDARIFTAPELYARVYEISLEEAVGEMYRGKRPLFCPEFNGIESLSARLRAFRRLPKKKQQELTAKYGIIKHPDGSTESSEHASNCQRRSDDVLDLIDGIITLLHLGHASPNIRIEKWTTSDRKLAREGKVGGRFATKAVLEHSDTQPLIDANRPVYQVIVADD